MAPNSGAPASTRAVNPRRDSANAVVSPPSPPPTIRMGSLAIAKPNSRNNYRQQLARDRDERSAVCQSRTHAPQQISGGAFAAVSFVDFSVECPFNKFYGINCRTKLGTK